MDKLRYIKLNQDIKVYENHSRVFMHSLTHEIFMPCQIFVPNPITPCQVLIHFCVSLAMGGGPQEKVVHIAITHHDSGSQMLLPLYATGFSLKIILWKNDTVLIINTNFKI